MLFRSQFLKGGSTPTILTKDLTNPTNAKTQGGGSFATHTATLVLNVRFSGYASNMQAGFGSLHYVNTGVSDSLNGKTIQEILDLANIGISGQGFPSGYDATKMANLVANLNLSFDNGVKSTWAQTHLSL